MYTLRCYDEKIENNTAFIYEMREESGSLLSKAKTDDLAYNVLLDNFL